MNQPYISADKKLPEFTFKALVLALFLAAILAAANVYLGLKVGLVISASIPAAVVAMALFRFSSNTNILENNIVQTGASASAAIASGIVFVIPALLIIKAWLHIDYWQSVFICAAGGTLGVLFSIPLRNAFLSHPELRFPEGHAIAEVLKVSEKSASLKELAWGSLVGGIIQLCQQGFSIFAYSKQLWFKAGSVVVGFGLGFDITMIGAGYIIGFAVGFSIFLGAIIGWIIGVPALSLYKGNIPTTHITDYVMGLWSGQIRYIGIGAMLVGGIWSLITAARPIVNSLKLSFQVTKSRAKGKSIRTEQDIPMRYAGIGIILLLAAFGAYMYYQLTDLALNAGIGFGVAFFIISLVYFIVAGFILSAICAYFSGLVGMSASPVSAVNIAALIIIAIILDLLLTFNHIDIANQKVVLHAAALSIIAAAIVACAASLANSTIQDLKTGEILGSTPWKLQIMLIMGTVVSTLVVPPVVELLYNAYGIANVFPHPGMNPANALGAPQASLIAALAQGTFFHNLPFHLIGIGAIITVGLIIVNSILKRYNKRLSVVGCAVGIYLPMSVTVPLVIGSAIALLIGLKHKKELKARGESLKFELHSQQQKVLLIACGLVAGGSIMGLLLSIPFAIKGDVTALNLVGPNFDSIAFVLSLISTAGVCWWMYRARR